MVIDNQAKDEPSETELFDGQRYYEAEEILEVGSEFPVEYEPNENGRGGYPDGIVSMRITENFVIDRGSYDEYGYNYEFLDSDGEVVRERERESGHRVHYNIRLNNGSYVVIRADN